MIKVSMRCLALFVLLIPALVSAGSLDDYYLSRLAPKAKAAQLSIAAVQKGGAALQADRCLTPIYRSLKRDWKQLEPATQKALAKQVSRPFLTNGASFYTPGGHFAIHYATSGPDAPNLADADGNSVPDWVETVGAVFDHVYAEEVGRMGFRPPPVARYDVYLLDLVSQRAYGFTSDDGFPSYPATSVASYIEIDKGFTASIFTSGGYSPEESLSVTAAHEFHHAIQYGYNYYFDIWYAEVTSTWMEDEVYDSVNQLYSYLSSYLPRASTLSLNAPIDGGSEYGRWIFNRYLAQGHSNALIKAIWTRLGTIAAPGDGSDIPMLPVIDAVLSNSGGSLSSEFFGFAKNAYLRNWTTHTGDLSRIPAVSAVMSFSNPVPSSVASGSVVTLPHYSFAYYKFLPSSSTATLTISLAKTSGIQATVYKKAGGTISEIAANADAASYTLSGFNALDEVALLLANTTSVDGHQASFSSDGSAANVDEPGVPVVPVGGSCGGANNNIFAVAPAQNLCDSGTATSVTGTGQWNWSCSGTGGGAPAACTAYLPTTIQNGTITSANGTITTLVELLLTDPILSPAAKPADFIPTGAINLSATVTSSGTATIQLSNLTSLPMNPVFYEVVGTQWVKMQPADYTLIGSTLTFKVTDNGPYDSDARLGFIQDLLVFGLATPSSSSSAGSGKSGCFIATAAYGSYLHPKVALLRAFRDDYLLTNTPGRLFVALYYRVSPPIADLIARHESLKVGTRLLLAPVVFAVEHCRVAFLLLCIGLAVPIVRRMRVAPGKNLTTEDTEEN